MQYHHGMVEPYNLILCKMNTILCNSNYLLRSMKQSNMPYPFHGKTMWIV